MEDYKNSKINEEDSRFDHIRKLARDLPDSCVVVNETQLEAEYDLIYKPKIEIERDRYDELLRAETMLDAVIRAAGSFTYELKEFIHCIIGDKFPAKKDGDDK